LKGPKCFICIKDTDTEPTLRMDADIMPSGGKWPMASALGAAWVVVERDVGVAECLSRVKGYDVQCHGNGAD
jgi:hypothetical protein